MKWCRWAVLAAGVVLFCAVSTGADAAPPATAFCQDTAELQGWMAQQFEPGIDQYTAHPNKAYVQGLARYLDKLSQEAPVTGKADLKVWATFTESVADGASQKKLAREVPAARAAAARVQVWLSKKSVCPQLYTTAALPPVQHRSHKVLYWVLAGVGAAVLLTVLASFQGAASTGRGATSTGGDGAAPKRSYGFGGDGGPKQKEKCGACSGRGRQPCGPCHGRGTVGDDPCSNCGRVGTTQCAMCLGSGTR